MNILIQIKYSLGKFYTRSVMLYLPFWEQKPFAIIYNDSEIAHWHFWSQPMVTVILETSYLRGFGCVNVYKNWPRYGGTWSYISSVCIRPFCEASWHTLQEIHNVLRAPVDSCDYTGLLVWQHTPTFITAREPWNLLDVSSKQFSAAYFTHWVPPNLRYKSRQIQKLDRFSSRLAYVFAQSIEAMCSSRSSREWSCSWSSVDDAPTTSEWLTSLLPIKARLKREGTHTAENYLSKCRPTT